VLGGAGPDDRRGEGRMGEDESHRQVRQGDPGLGGHLGQSADGLQLGGVARGRRVELLALEGGAAAGFEVDALRVAAGEPSGRERPQVRTPMP